MRHEYQNPLHQTAAATQERASRWLARFAGLLEDDPELSAAECRRRLQEAESLAVEGPGLLADLEAASGPDDPSLLAAFREALEELNARQEELRRRLGELVPGDPAGRVDPEAIRAKIAEARARREVEEIAGGFGPAGLELTTSRSQLGGALFMGIFSLGWLSFTTVHAVFMIGGMMQAFGPLALALLAFYAIFWSIGIGMGYGAVCAARSETVRIQGHELTLQRRIGPYAWGRRFDLASKSRARVVRASFSARTGDSSPPAASLAVDTADGKEIRFGSSPDTGELQRLADEINRYLSGQ